MQKFLRIWVFTSETLFFLGGKSLQRIDHDGIIKPSIKTHANEIHARFSSSQKQGEAGFTAHFIDPRSCSGKSRLHLHHGHFIPETNYKSLSPFGPDTFSLQCTPANSLPILWTEEQQSLVTHAVHEKLYLSSPSWPLTFSPSSCPNSLPNQGLYQTHWNSIAP